MTRTLRTANTGKCPCAYSFTLSSEIHLNVELPSFTLSSEKHLNFELPSFTLASEIRLNFELPSFTLSPEIYLNVVELPSSATPFNNFRKIHFSFPC